MIKPVADAIAAPATQLLLAERHSELMQITQLVEQPRGWPLAARERPSDLRMRQAEVQRKGHIMNVITHLIALEHRTALLGTVIEDAMQVVGREGVGEGLRAFPVVDAR